jgi:hypothetical protein
MLCPRCDGQGSIHQEKVLELGIILFICDECDACWTKVENIGKSNFKDLSAFLEEHGTSYEEATIEKIGDLDENTH